MSIIQAVQVIFLVLFPLLAIKLSGSTKKLGFVSPIFMCYLTGIIIGNIYYIPVDRKLAMTISEIAVPLAIPLILFSIDLRRWVYLAKKTIISFFLVIISAFAGASLGALAFSGMIGEYWKVSAMLVGVYTGGTANLIAVGIGLRTSEETLLLTNTSDAVIGGIYLIFLLTGAKWVYRKLLPPFKGGGQEVQHTGHAGNGTQEGFSPETIAAVVLALCCVGISIGSSLLITGGLDAAIVMLSVTTLGLLGSFIKKIRNIKGTYEAGQYAILVFSLAIGMNVNLSELLASSPIIFIYTTVVMMSAIIIHFVLAAIFRIDADTALITNTACIYGPPFIGPVAEAMKNREVIVSGLTCGLAGYALGNYLGFAAAWLLMPK